MNDSIPEHEPKTSPRVSRSIADLLRALQQARKRGDFFRECFQQSLHMLHAQQARIRRQDARIVELCEAQRDERRSAA